MGGKPDRPAAEEFERIEPAGIFDEGFVFDKGAGSGPPPPAPEKGGRGAAGRRGAEREKGRAPRRRGRGGPRRARRQAKARRGRPSLKKRLLVGVLGLVALTVGGLWAYLEFVTRSDGLWLDLEQIPYKTATVIYAREEGGDWQEYAVLPCTQDKEYVPGDQMPRWLKDAFVAVEDKDFYSHRGVNLARTCYAALNELSYALTGSYLGGEDGIKVGASTIDQQLVKNLLRDDKDEGVEGYLRKLREIWRAFRLDAAYDKETILEAYLNTISFTGNTAGVAAEARKLFGAEVSELTLAQCASLAAITRSPARYDPATHPQQHLQRRDYVLGQMRAEGFITEEEYRDAVAQPLQLAPAAQPPEEAPPTSYFTDALMEELIAAFADQWGLGRAEATRLLYDGGLRIYATVVPALQTAMEETLGRAAVYPQPARTITRQLTDAEGQLLWDESGAPVQGPVTVRPQAAMASLNYSGEVCALVGGLGEKTVSRGFNRATQATRQVGSTMKPIGPYLLAVQRGRINWSTPLLDAPVRQMPDPETGEMKDWPANFSGSYTGGDILAADALARSINTIAVRVGEGVGVNDIYRFATDQLKITSFLPEDRASGPMILGSSTTGVSLLEMAAAYSIFGSGGSYTTPHLYLRVEKGTGELLLSPQPVTRQVVSPDTAYILNRMLAGVMQGQGTGAGYAVNDGMESVGKTGTTSDNRDHWFIGLTPYYVTASWYGYDDNLPLAVDYSAHPPTLGWRNVMRAAQQGLPAREFPVDDLVQQLAYCTVTGLLPAPGCPVATGYYKRGQGPRQTCPGH